MVCSIIFGAHSSIISNLGIVSFFRKNDTHCKVQPVRSHSVTGILKYKSLSRNKSISACLCVYVLALSCVGRLLSPIKCPKHCVFSRRVHVIRESCKITLNIQVDSHKTEQACRLPTACCDVFCCAATRSCCLASVKVPLNDVDIGRWVSALRVWEKIRL